MEHKLDCCVVRDLLPAYLEGLTEEETTRQVEAHLEECPECRRRREAMQASLPVVRAPKRALAFLKKVKRTRLIAAVLSAVVALLLIFLVYDSEYHWRGDLPSLTQGLQDYLGWTDHLEGCAIEALAATEVDGTLYVSFTSDSEDNVHGVAELDRGLNGKYQFVSASYSPFPYTGGVFLHSSEDLWLFAGVGCREIYGFTAQFEVYDSQGQSPFRCRRTPSSWLSPRTSWTWGQARRSMSASPTLFSCWTRRGRTSRRSMRTRRSIRAGVPGPGRRSVFSSTS